MVYCYENAKKYLKNGGLQQIAGRQDMDNDKNRKAISENESIQEGLESFLDQELGNMKPSSASMGKSVSKPELKSILEEDVWEEEESFDSDYYEDDDDDYVIRRRRVYDEDMEDPKGRKVDTDEDDDEYEDDGYEDDEYDEDEENFVREKRQCPGRERSKGKSRKKSPAKKRPAKKGNAKKSKKKAGGKKQKGKKKNKLLKILLGIALLLLILFLLMNHMVNKAYNKMNYEESEELADEPMIEEGVINVLLIGNDSRQNGEDGRSDAMILVSVNQKEKTIHMTSFLRDMYVTIPGHGQNRLNAAYSYGGATLLCQTLKENFNIEVNRYAIVNFQAFAALVDAVGGVDIDITSEEVEWINAYLNEYNMLEGREITTDYLDTSLSGVVHLNGPQALAYCRNRYIGTDFGRTERQRKVLSAIMKKVPVAMATNSEALMDGIFPYLTTNLTQKEVSSLSLKAGGIAGYENKSLMIPADGTWSNANIDGKAVLQVDFEANKKILKEEIYGEKQETTDEAISFAE
ncbi:MAG: LCP family protein [Lachnospiraceae bacterium]|nr:LCP family protein [Lachnospiraceae bacterium]